MFGWLMSLIGVRVGKVAKIGPFPPKKQGENDTRDSDDDEPLDWSPEESFDDVYIHSDDEGEEGKRTTSAGARRPPPMMSRIKTMLAPSLRKKITKPAAAASSTAALVENGKKKMKKKKKVVMRHVSGREKATRKPPIPTQKSLRKKKKKTMVTATKKKGKKAPVRVDLRDQEVQASQQYRHAMRQYEHSSEPLYARNQSPEHYHDVYVASDPEDEGSEYETDSEEDSEEEEEEWSDSEWESGSGSGSELEQCYGDDLHLHSGSSIQTQHTPAAAAAAVGAPSPKYFTFTWDGHKQPSGTAAKADPSPEKALEPIVMHATAAATAAACDKNSIILNSRSTWRGEEEKSNCSPSSHHKDSLPDDDLQHFSFTWSHKENPW
jgi:hypothetical protein